LIRDIAESRFTEEGGCGCVVFCDWTEEMSMIEEALLRSPEFGEQGGIEVRSFHGRLSVPEREDVIDSFRRSCVSPEVAEGRTSTVLIAQVKCAAQGLNLQCASRAYLMRPQWNPAIERQAVGRLHRSGQRRAVTVIRLVAKGTVDEVALRRQRNKLKCISEVMRDDDMTRVLWPKRRLRRTRNVVGGATLGETHIDAIPVSDDVDDNDE
jgi:SNF2 family DNA or RNA helicase